MAGLVSALRSKLTSREDYEKLVGSSSLKEVLDFYHDKFGLLVVYGQPGDELRLLQSVTGNYYKAAKLVRSFSPPGLRKVINVILEKEELEFLGSLLMAIAEDRDPETIGALMPAVGPYDEDRIKRMVETRSVRRAAESVEDAELRESIMAAINEPGVSAKAAVDLAVHAVFSKRLWRTTKVFLTGQHAESVKRIMGQWLDLQNILLVARSRSLGIPSKVILSFLLPIQYRIQRSIIEDMAGSSVTDIVPKISATTYQRAIVNYERVSRSGLEISRLETSFQRYMAAQCFQAFAGSRFSAGLAVSFLFLKLFETQDLKVILTGKLKSIPPSDIWRNIVLHSPPIGQR